MDWKEFLKKDDFSGEEMDNMQIPAAEWLVEQILYLGGGCLWTGASNTGKSALCLQLAMNLSAGTKFLEKFPTTKEFRVLYLQCEGGKSANIRRYKSMAKRLRPRGKNIRFWYSLGKYHLDAPNAADELMEKFKDYDPEVIIFDPLYKLVMSGSMSDDTVASRVTTTLDILKQKYQKSVILVHHTHKDRYTQWGGEIDEGINKVFGVGFYDAWSDSHIMMSTKISRGSAKYKESMDLGISSIPRVMSKIKDREEEITWSHDIVLDKKEGVCFVLK